jgi:hypothetical protein
MRLEQRFLDHVGGVEFAPETRVKLNSGEQLQVLAVRFERAAAGRGVGSHPRFLLGRT